MVRFWTRLGMALEKPVMLVFRRHADYMISMRLAGRAVDASTREPLSGVQVSFVDTGFDSRRSVTPEEHSLLVAETQEDGRFDTLFRYMWGQEIVWLMKGRVGESFELWFRRPGFQVVRKSFDPRKLPYEGNVLQVALDEDVALSPMPT